MNQCTDARLGWCKLEFVGLEACGTIKVPQSRVCKNISISMLMKLSSMYFFECLFLFLHSAPLINTLNILINLMFFITEPKSTSHDVVNIMSLIVELDLQEVLDVDLVHVVDDVLIVEQTRITQAALAGTARRNLNALRRNLDLTRVRLSPTTTLCGVIALCVHMNTNIHTLIRNIKV